MIWAVLPIKESKFFVFIVKCIKNLFNVYLLTFFNIFLTISQWIFFIGLFDSKND